MNRIGAIIARYDTAIWIRVIGTILTTLAGFMLRPFLVFYLYDKLNGSVLMSMVILGLQSVSSILMNLWGGGLTDRYGRKPLMLLALLTQMLSMIGFIFAVSVWEFAIFAILNGLGWALFFPAANAQVADVVPEEKRAEVFALLHTALNVGAAAGPLMGLLIFSQNTQVIFSVSAITFFIYTLLVWWKVPETLPHESRDKVTAVKPPKLSIREHKHIYLMMLFALPVGMLYAQVEATFPLHLKTHFDNYKSVFAWLMTINGTIVIMLQMWIAKKTENMPVYKVVIASYCLFACVAIGYGYAPVFALLVLSEVVFTLGEMMNGPHMQKAVSLLAPADMRGRYFSVFSLSWQIPRAIGPLLGGLVFNAWGGEVLFLLLAALLVAGGLAQNRLLRVHSRQTQPVPSVPSAVAET